MAVINAYTDPKISGNIVQKLLRAFNAQGTQVNILFATITCGATDSNGSVYRAFKDLNRAITLTQIFVSNTANTAGTSYGLGLYSPDLSLTTQTTVGYFSGVMDMSAAAASLNPKTAKDGMAAITPTTNNRNNRLFEHAGYTVSSKPQPQAYDLCLTATTAGSAGGTVEIQAHFALD